VHVEDGAIWLLDAHPDAAALADKRVKLKGTRSGFDKFSVVYPRRNIPANLPFVQRIQNLD
jgi:Protein of unknown function (DUF5818)